MTLQDPKAGNQGRRNAVRGHKPEVFLHIGTMKTGTTSIQQVFDLRRAELLAQHAYYPLSPGARAHELLTYAATEGRRGPPDTDPFWKGMDRQARLAAFRTDFDKEMREIPARVTKIIISDERFSFYLRTREEIAALKAMLTPYFENFTIIAYLRRQDSFLASRYSEQLRVGAVGEPDNRRELARLLDYDYQSLLDNWASVFGEKAIKPRLYERGEKGSFDWLATLPRRQGCD